MRMRAPSFSYRLLVLSGSLLLCGLIILLFGLLSLGPLLFAVWNMLSGQWAFMPELMVFVVIGWVLLIFSHEWLSGVGRLSLGWGKK